MASSHLVISKHALVQVVVTNLFTAGYRFFVTGWLDDVAKAAAIDAKLVAKYGMNFSRSKRWREHQAGRARLRYLRHERFFVMLATEGEHAWFVDEAESIHDARVSRFGYGGYSTKLERRGRHTWSVHTRLQRETFNQLRKQLLNVALEPTGGQLRNALWRVPFDPYGGVRADLLCILDEANRRRKRAHVPLVSPDSVPWRRKVMEPFVDHEETLRQGSREPAPQGSSGPRILPRAGFTVTE